MNNLNSTALYRQLSNLNGTDLARMMTVSKKYRNFIQANSRLMSKVSRNMQKKILRQTINKIINAKARGNNAQNLKNEFVNAMRSLYPNANQLTPYQAFHDIILIHTPNFHRTIFQNAAMGAPEDPRTQYAQKLVGHLKVVRADPFYPLLEPNFNLNKFLKSRNLKP